MTKISIVNDSRASICEMRKSLFMIYEKQIASSPEDAPRKVKKEKLREFEIQMIDALCKSILFKIESLSYKLETIKSLEWHKYHDFEYHLSEAKNTATPDNDKVRQELQGGKLIILCKDSKIMENYIFTEIATFFSNISGIIDNIGYILKFSFQLEIDKEEIKIYDVYDKIKDPLRNLLYVHLLKDPTFGGMRDVRKACEHRALTQVFEFGRMRALGDRDLGPPNILGVPYISDEIVKNTDKEDRRLDKFCEFLHRKLCDFLDQFIATIIKIS